jgi:hypothetical protein
MQFLTSASFTTLLVLLAVPALWTTSSNVVQAEEVVACEAESLAAEQCFLDTAFACEAACEGFDAEPDLSSLTLAELTNPEIICPLIFNPFCTLYSCCPQCETEARAFFDCSVVQASTDGVVCDGIVTGDDYCANIPVVDTGNGDDTGATSEPDDGTVTSAPSGGSTPAVCEAESLEIQLCFASSQAACEADCSSATAEEPDFSSLTLEELGDPEVLCPLIFQPFCLLLECCPQCQSETQAFVDCLLAQTADEEGVSCDAVLTDSGCSIEGTDAGSGTGGTDTGGTGGTDGTNTGGTDGTDAEEEEDGTDATDATDGTDTSESSEATNGSGAAVIAVANGWSFLAGILLLLVGYCVY